MHTLSAKNACGRLSIPLCLLICAHVFSSAVTAAQWQLFSPDSSLHIDIAHAESFNPFAGQTDLCYSVSLGTDTVFPWSPLGLEFSEPYGADSLAFLSAAFDTIDETYGVRAGKCASARNSCRQATLDFSLSAVLKIRIIFRAYNDGIAYRYAVTEGPAHAAISKDLSGFVLPAGSAAWLQKVDVNYESFYDTLTVGAPVPADAYGNFPALFHTPDNVWVLCTEAWVGTQNAASHFSIGGPANALFSLALPQGIVAASVPWDMPWRAAVINRGLEGIVASSLVDNLNPPCAVADTAWIHPGRVAWSWWGDAASTGSLSAQKEHVDFARRAGWEYVLVDDGWNSAWMPELTEYAAAQSVGILLWYKYAGLDSEAERAAELSQCVAWGVAGIKADFFSNDGQDRMQDYDAILRACADKKLLVNFHGCTMYRGQQRTWPHLMTMEAVHGAEHYKFTVPPEPWQNCVLPFTRNAVGPMDYTPVTFSAGGRATTAAHELALAVVFASGLQHFADSPASYISSGALDMLERVPAAWDNTKLVSGYPGRHAVVARRAGSDWYVAGICAGEAQTVTVALPFVKQGSYTVTLYGDSAGSARIAARQITIDTRGDAKIVMAGNGGFCFVAENAYDAERDTCAAAARTSARNRPAAGWRVQACADGFRVNGNGRRPLRVRVLDLKGRCLHTALVTQETVVPPAGLASGVHIIRCNAGAQVIARRFVHP